MSADLLADVEGPKLVARIHHRKRLTTELQAADDAHTLAVQASVGGYGDWRAVQQAGEVVKQAQAALTAAEARA